MLRDSKILVIVSGGIAAYKIPHFVRLLKKWGAKVRVVMTRAAQSFVAPLALETVSQSKVGLDLFAFEGEIGHIELARWADLVFIAPATADFIARLAAGMADDLATTLVLATTAKVMLAPAMNTKMWEHPATQRNVELLKSWGYEIIAPDRGELACEEVGAGRMPDPEHLSAWVCRGIYSQALKGHRVLISAGPTRNYIDPVRFISNPSTGKMGISLAKAAWYMGAEVRLVLGPVCEWVPPEIEVIRIEENQEMEHAVLDDLLSWDWLVMSAAVGDWKVREFLKEKRKKGLQGEHWSLDLIRTRDILKEAVRKRGTHVKPIIVGFSAETHELERHAREKRKAKGCDVIFGNWVKSQEGNAFGADQTRILAIDQHREQWLGPFSKERMAIALWQWLLKIAENMYE